jgi:signal transduction histidine kinase
MARQELDAMTGSVDLVELAHEFDDVEVHTEPDLPLAEGDADVVRRALAPLIDNARRHANSEVTVELSTAGDRVRAAVRDDGPGLDPELAERVFEPGFQTGEGTGSAGLGLPLARRLARSCGGDVAAGPGPGGCFVLELPRAT